MSADWVGSYRLQVHAGFTLEDAAGILPYLADLGVSHVYLSPCLQAMPGSMHGYDVTDPSRISEDLGGEESWAAFVGAARAHGLKILLDIVPNHMAASEHNPWWDDVLMHGPFSAYAQFFDIRTEPHRPFRVNICSLAHDYGESLEKRELELEVRGGRPRLKHYDNSWPLGPASWGVLLAADDRVSAEGRRGCFEDLERLRWFADLSAADRTAYRLAADIAQDILEDAHREGRLQRAVDRAQGDPAAVDAIIERQFFTLHGWKLASELTNYRRFFDVGSLVGIRTELPRVFEASHERIGRMVSQGEVDGLRIDHPDGLRDPRGYFGRLRRAPARGPPVRREDPGERRAARRGLARRRDRGLRFPGEGESALDG